MNKKFYIETYGCQMNIAESNALALMLEKASYIMASDPSEADVVILNTCSVRNSAESRIWGRLGFYRHLKSEHSFILILTGCMGQRLGQEAKKEAPQIDYVVPINDKLRILEIISSKNCQESENYTFTESYYKEGEFSSYVPIMNGCNNFCSYCIVPYVRGREVSRPVEQIVDEIRFLDSKNVREVTLLGQNVNSYKYGNVDFPQLLKRVVNECNNIQWIRFESPHPKDFSKELIEVIATQDKVAKHLHVPMQSGNTRILNLMNRRYSREDYLNLIDRIKTRIPEITFAVDVMVGFPGETEEEFMDTVSAIDHVGYIEAYMYYWNEREGTRAVTMEGQIPEKERQVRLQKLIDHQLANASAIKTKRTGDVQKVLVVQVSRDNEKMMLGRNEHNEMVAFESNAKPGDMVNVRFDSLNGNTFVGTEV